MSTAITTNSTQLTVTERAIKALGFNAEKEAKLRELAERTTTIATITNKDGYTQVHNGRMALKNERVEIQNAGKVARDDATKFSKAVIAEEKRLIAVTSPEEDRLEKIQDAYDAAIEAAKQAKIDAELKRVTDLQERVAYLRGSPNISSLSPPELIAEHFSDLESEVVDASMQEYEQQALEAKASGLSRLRDMHAAAVARVAEREELNRLRAEAAERDRKEKEARDAEHAKQQAELAAERQRIADEERAAKQERDRQQAIHDAQLKAQRDQEEKERRERQSVIDAENARIAEANRVEAKRLADAQAVIDKREAEEKRQREAREAAGAERARIGAITEPTRDEIIGVVAKHWNVPVEIVAKWKPFKGGSSRQAAA